MIEQSEDHPVRGSVTTHSDQWVMHFDSNGYLTSIDDSAGNTLEVDTGTGGRVESVTDAVGRELQFHYKEPGECTGCDACAPTGWSCDDVPTGGLACITEDDVLGRCFHLAYAYVGRIETIYDAMEYDIAIEYGDSQGPDADRIISITDKEGDAFTYEYDQDDGRLTKVTDPEPDQGDPLDQSFIWQCQWSTFYTLYYDRRGSCWKYTYNGNGYLTQRRSPLLTVEQFTYDSDRNLTDYYDGVNNHWEWEYDDYGQVTTATDPTVPTLITLPEPVAEGEEGEVTLTYYDDQSNTPGLM